jgi:hypothetical protein
MGTFGSDSYSNDTVWDWLGAAEKNVDIHAMTDKQIRKALDHFLSEKPEPLKQGKYDDDRQTFLGMVVWALRDALSIPEQHLKLALKCAQELLSDPAHLEPWRDETERENCLIMERREIEYALAHNGKSHDKPFSMTTKKWKERDFPVYVPVVSQNGIFQKRGTGSQLKSQIEKHQSMIDEVFDKHIGPQVLLKRYDGSLFKVTIKFDTEHITEDEWDGIAKKNNIETVLCKICKHNALKEKAIAIDNEFVGYECCRKRMKPDKGIGLDKKKKQA